VSQSQLLLARRVTLITPIPVAALSNRWFVCQRVLQVWEKDRSLRISGVGGAEGIPFTRPRASARVADMVKLPSSESTDGVREIVPWGASSFGKC